MPDIKLFSLEEAERALPLVRRIVADLQEEYAGWREAVAKYELVAAGAHGDAEEPNELARLRQAVTVQAERIAALVEELRGIGCEIKDFEVGLVDFYSLLDDRLVFLCWRMGEDRVSHWHEIDGGFAGRQPIDHAMFPGTVP